MSETSVTEQPTALPAVACSDLLDALVQACKAWRTAEKRWAAIYTGAIGGDSWRAKTIEERKLNELRIAFDKWEASK